MWLVNYNDSLKENCQKMGAKRGVELGSKGKNPLDKNNGPPSKII